MGKMEEGDKSRQEKHCWQVQERQEKAKPKQELKGNLKGKTLSPQVKQTAAVQYTAPGSLQLSYQNMGGEGLWLYTPSVWQGRGTSPSFPEHFNVLKTLLNASSENTSKFLKVSLPCYNRRRIKGSKSYYRFSNYMLQNMRVAYQVPEEAACGPAIPCLI